MIYIAGISIALFIAALLLIKRNKSHSDLILIIWVLVNALHLSLFYLQDTEQIYNYPALLGVQLPLPLLHGMLLYFYVSSVTNHSKRKNWVTGLHLLPTLLSFIYLIPFYALPAAEKIEIFKNQGQGYEGFLSILIISVFLSGVIYVIWSSLLLRKHRQQIKHQFSDIEEINLAWLQFLTYGMGLVWCLVIFTQQDAIIFGGVSVFVILIGFFGIQQKNIFDNKAAGQQLVFQEKTKIDATKPTEEEEKKDKYESSGLSMEMADSLFKRLYDSMHVQKLYRKSELSLRELAKELETHPNYLSQIINDKEGKNFYDYINTYRVEDFKSRIEDPQNQHYTLMSVAFDCGFNSKSSFNRYFKKLTGQTPSQYVKAFQN